MSERAEAVIISGRRRGQIIQLSGSGAAEANASDWQALNQALDKLNKKLATVSEEVRDASRAINASRRKI